MSTRNELSASRRILEEHQALHHELDRLEDGADRVLEGAVADGWTEDIAARVAALRPRLSEHFAREVELGLFEDIERAWPNTERACRQLVVEHGLLLHGFDEVAGATETGVPPPVLARQLKSLLGALRRHEERENELLRLVLEGGPPAGD